MILDVAIGVFKIFLGGLNVGVVYGRDMVNGDHACAPFRLFGGIEYEL